MFLETIQSLVVFAVILAIAFACAKSVMGAELNRLANTPHQDAVSMDVIMNAPEGESPTRQPLRLVWSAPADVNDEPFDQMK